MLQIFDRLRIARALGRLIEDPAQTEQIFEISRLGRRSLDRRGIEAMLAHVSRDVEFMQLYRESYRPKLPTMAELAACPTGSLGRVYHDHLAANGLQPDFFPDEPGRDLLSYVIARARQTHDIWHVLTGFDTSVPGEMALQAFTLAQTHAGLSVALLFGGMMHISQKRPEDLGSSLDLVMEGFERGRKARFLLGIPWEALLDMPLEEARRLAGLGEVAKRLPAELAI